MNLWTLIGRSIRFHWRSHLGVILGAAVSTAVLVGALVIGDSVRYSLRYTALARLGETEVALVAPDRFFRDDLADRMIPALGAPAAAVLQTPGIATRQDAAARINQVQVLGVDRRFWNLGGGAALLPDNTADAVVINEAAARRLGVKAGDAIRVRLRKPSALPLDAPLSGEPGTTFPVDVTVRAVAGDADFGRFSLQANQVAPFNVYASRAWLQKQIGQAGRANVLLVGRRSAGAQPTPADASAALAQRWRPADAELSLHDLPGRRLLELRSRRIFIDTPVSQAVAAMPEAVGILTYLVNELRVGDLAAPYSMVTAIGPLGGNENSPGATAGLLPADMHDDEVLVNSWLAADTGAKPGDTLEMAYFVMGAAGRLQTQSSRFRVRAVLPLDGPAADRTLMPDFPGMANVDNCRDWKPGIPIDLKKIRKQDEAYWNQYRGTPKAFVTLAAGQRMWANRFGNLTAVRFPAEAGAQAKIDAALALAVPPASLGLYFQPVRERALAASGQALDFGQLFLGLSFFLVATALVLTGMLFGLSIEERSEEVGTLLALGFPPRRVRRMLLLEGVALAAVGGAIGTVCGLLYTRVMLLALATVWRGAVASADLHFHTEPLTPLIGAVAGLVVAAGAIWLTVRRQARAPARELLAAGADAELRLALPRQARGRLAPVLAVAGVVGAAAILATTYHAKGEAAAGAFFGAGAILLIAGLAACQTLLARLARPAAEAGLSLAGLGLRGAGRRRGRSLATIALLACGAFLVVSVGANRKSSLEDADLRTSGTGGFALYGETTVPVFQDLNSEAGRNAFGLPDEYAGQVKFVPMRVHAGDDASCLNLNRAQSPRLLGVRPEEPASRGAFAFAETTDHPAGESPWLLLDKPDAEGAVPAIADANTITWALGKAVGQTLPYTDERGRTFQIRLAGALSGSILQGSLVLSERAFIEKFPSESGYRAFLVDAPAGDAPEIAKTLSERMSDVGLAAEPAYERLAAFNSVENTYLTIFQALGGLGLVLGSIGLGVVVVRNVLERRGELALLRAVGFRRASLDWLVLYEHWTLLVMGLVCGVAAALVAVFPAIRAAGTQVPYVSLAVTLAAVLASGLLWTYLAARWALGGALLAALRNE